MPNILSHSTFTVFANCFFKLANPVPTAAAMTARLLLSTLKKKLAFCTCDRYIRKKVLKIYLKCNTFESDDPLLFGESIGHDKRPSLRIK
jgi:hypothetical protein